MSYFSDYAPTLYKGGYDVLPLVPGEKRPALPNWTKIKIDEKEFPVWGMRTGTGVGLRCGNGLVALDFDIYDRDVADAFRRDYRGEIVRTGQPPKFLVPFQPAGGLPTKKQKITFEDILGTRHAVELLVKGQQFVAYGKHPDTGKDYHYSSGDIVNAPINSLHVLTSNELFDVFRTFAALATDAGWQLVSNTLADAINGAGPDDQPPGAIDSIDNYKPPLDLTHEQISQILAKVDPTEYDSWLRVGMALHHQFQGAAIGLKAWDKWSRRTGAGNYTAGACTAKWGSFGTDGAGIRSTITFATLIKDTDFKIENPVLRDRPVASGKVPGEADTLTAFLSRYAFMPEGNAVLDLNRPVDSALLEIAAFRNLTAGQRQEVDCPVSRQNPEGVRLEPIHKFWLCDSKRLTVEGSGYWPGSMERLVSAPDGRLWLNTAHFPDWAAVLAGSGGSNHKASLIQPVLDHLEYLMPNPDERAWFVGWLAFQVQRPHQRCKVTPLHISLAHGTGRGWIVSLIEQLLGKWNVTSTTMAELCGEGSAGAYHDYFDKSLVCTIGEVYEGGKRFTISDLLRDKLTENRLNVNLKYGGKGTRDIHTNFFWMSNHNDAVVLPPGDRRVYVIGGPSVEQSASYYDSLYSWLAVDLNVAVLYSWLAASDLSGFEWQRAPMSSAKRQMRVFNQTDTEGLFMDFIESPPFPYMSISQVIAAMNAMMIESGAGTELFVSIETNQVKKLLQHHAVYHDRQVRLASGERLRAWCFGGESQSFLDNKFDEIKASLEGSQERFLKGL